MAPLSWIGLISESEVLFSLLSKKKVYDHSRETDRFIDLYSKSILNIISQNDFFLNVPLFQLHLLIQSHSNGKFFLNLSHIFCAQKFNHNYATNSFNLGRLFLIRVHNSQLWFFLVNQCSSFLAIWTWFTVFIDMVCSHRKFDLLHAVSFQQKALFVHLIGWAFTLSKNFALFFKHWFS